MIQNSGRAFRYMQTHRTSTKTYLKLTILCIRRLQLERTKGIYRFVVKNILKILPKNTTIYINQP